MAEQTKIQDAEVVPAEVKDQALAVAKEPSEIGALLSRAIDKDTSVEALEKLVTLYERVEDRRAGQEFADALSQFQNECPSIPRKSTANIATRGGSAFSYKYAELDQIASVVNPLLHKRGLSYSWDSYTTGGDLTCIFILRHVNGHKTESKFACPLGSKAGMSEQQKAASALTFAKRQSMTAGLGLTTCDLDNDGGDETGETIDTSQVANLRALMEEVKADAPKFLDYMQVDSLESILASNYKQAVEALEEKRKRG